MTIIVGGLLSSPQLLVTRGYASGAAPIPTPGPDPRRATWSSIGPDPYKSVWSAEREN